MFLQQQIENEFMNAGEDEDSDDGLVLAGDGNAGLPPFNGMSLPDPSMDMHYQKLAQSK